MVGGTFESLHDGHKRLLTRWFELPGPDGPVVIGLTSDSFASRKIQPNRPFAFTEAGSRTIYPCPCSIKRVGH